MILYAAISHSKVVLFMWRPLRIHVIFSPAAFASKTLFRGKQSTRKSLQLHEK